jgi:transcriptional regulator with XRE-family HTH domain
VNQRQKSVVQQICTLRSVGVGVTRFPTAPVCFSQSEVVFLLLAVDASPQQIVDRGYQVLHLQSASPTGNASPTIIDVHVGNRIRLRRMMLGLPMARVAKSLGISWQQLRKYERASDRISASRLYLIALALGTTIDFFFAESQPDEANGHTVGRLPTPAIVNLIPHDARGQQISQLIASYWRIADVKQRNRVLDLMHALADEKPKSNTTPIAPIR